MSSMPTTTEGLRQKYRIMSNCSLLPQMRQPARHLFSDLTVLTFPTFCDELLSDRNFLLEEEIGENKVIKPEWNLCLSYELEIRREAIRLTREQRMPIQQAMWAAYRDQPHRLENWSNFLKLESKKVDESSKDAQIASLERRLKIMENRLIQRSRSPRGKGRALPAPKQLALAAPAAPQDGQAKGKARGKNNRRKGKGNHQRTPPGQNIQTFRELLTLKRVAHPEWLRSPPGICFALNEKKCTDAACTRPQRCVACRSALPYDYCRCVQA